MKSKLSARLARSRSRRNQDNVVICGCIIGLEMGSVWNRLGSEVTVVKSLSTIGGVGIDEEASCVLANMSFC